MQISAYLIIKSASAGAFGGTFRTVYATTQPLEATSGIEPLYKGFADPRLTTWLRRRFWIEEAFSSKSRYLEYSLGRAACQKQKRAILPLGDLCVLLPSSQIWAGSALIPPSPRPSPQGEGVPPCPRDLVVQRSPGEGTYAEVGLFAKARVHGARRWRVPGPASSLGCPLMSAPEGSRRASRFALGTRAGPIATPAGRLAGRAPGLFPPLCLRASGSA